MEEYLNKVKQLTDQLKAKSIEMPSQVIVAWVLNNLTSPYEGFVTMVTQSYRTILEKVRCILFHAKLPKFLWGEAVNTAVYLYNRTPHSQLHFKTPYQVLNDIKPDITNIRVFGSVAYYKVKVGLKKLDPRAKKAILLGFGNNLYRLYDTESKRLIWARDVKILENQFYNFSKEANLEANQESLFDLN
jgi:hypothetical protein